MKFMAKVIVFQKYVKLQGKGHKVQIYGTMWKGLVTRNAYVKYESPISSGMKVLAKVKVFQR